MERISGVTLYDVWYQLDEKNRKDVISKLVTLLKSFHFSNSTTMDFSLFIKKKIETYSSLILKKQFFSLLQICDVIFQENTFGYLHGDLHFDNIIYDNGNIKLLDFECARPAPIDYEFRIFYFCHRAPWYWASGNDMLQVERDYEYLWDYVKEFYVELQDIPYLSERMAMYELLDLLERYFETQDSEFSSLIQERIDYLISHFKS